MNITTVSTTREIPAKYQYLPITPGKLPDCLAELARRWPNYDPGEGWYLKTNSTLFVPAEWVRK